MSDTSELHQLPAQNFYGTYESCQGDQGGARGESMEQGARWWELGRGVALATGVNPWGSSPRRVGAKLAVSGGGGFVGSVSGGCVEGAVVEEALATIRDGKPRLLDFGVSNEQAWEVGLACGGKIEIFVERVD